MSVVKVTKSIRIDERVLDKIEAVDRLFDEICEDLEDIVREDDYYSFLLECGNKASACIKDFLGTYAERDI